MQSGFENRIYPLTERYAASSSIGRVIEVDQASLILSRNYHENIVDHYENPRNVGAFDKNDTDVGTVSLFYFS